MNSQNLTVGETTYAEIVEVTPDKTRVFDLAIRGSKLGSAYTVYRVERIGDVRR